MLKIIDDGLGPGRTLYSVKIPVRWGDMDADGHVNNTTVLRFVEEARMRWVSALGLEAKPPGPIPLVVNVACTFHAPIEYPATVQVEISCTHVGNSSLAMAFALQRAETPALQYASACVTWVWVDSTTKRPIPMPAKLRAACAERA